MTSPDYLQHWEKIESDLRRARRMLPLGAENHKAIREYEEFLTYNEFELACDMLEEFAEEHPVSREFWVALRDASMKMKLDDRAARYDGRAAAG